MIGKEEIDAMATALRVNTSDVQRDYIFGWLLSGLGAGRGIGRDLILTGGNCFRKGYFEDARFSSDLDFIAQHHVDPRAFGEELKEVCRYITDRTDVPFKLDDTVVKQKRCADEDTQTYEARVYFQGFYGAESYHIRAKMDVSEYERLRLPTQERPILHPYSDGDKCEGTVTCVKLEELLASKLKALLQRRHSPDLYDFVFSVFFQNALEVDRGELLSTFLSKTIWNSRPRVAAGLLLNLPFKAIADFWDRYLVCPVSSLISCETAEERFKNMISALFGVGERFAFAGSVDPDFFRPEHRGLLMEAGREQRMLRMVYRGTERQIEPYALKYKIRRNDRVGREYLFAWDVTGGTRGTYSIKTYTQDGVESLELMDQSFQPRYPIELSKAGDREENPYFGDGPRARRGIRTRRSNPRAPRFLSAKLYKVQCPVCGKRFPRARPMDTKLNKHKGAFGTSCPGRVGYPV